MGVSPNADPGGVGLELSGCEPGYGDGLSGPGVFLWCLMGLNEVSENG